MTALAEALLARVGGKATVAATVALSAAPAPAVCTAPLPWPQPQKPAETYTISKAQRLTGLPRETLYRLYHHGFVRAWRPSPKRILLDVGDLCAFLVESAEPGYWTAERTARFHGKAVAS